MSENNFEKKSDADKVKELCSRWEQLKSERAKFESRWSEAQKYCDNNELSWGDINSLPTQPKRNSSSPFNYAKTLIAGIIGYAISPSIPWFKLSLERQDLLNAYGVKDWLEKCERVLIAAFNRSNFYKESVQAVKDAVIIGHGPLLLDEDIENARLRFTKFPANELYFDVNEYGEYDTCYRWYSTTLRNFMQFFGADDDNIDESYKEAYEKPERWNDRIELLQCVFPREDFNPDEKDSKNMPFACYYIDNKHKKIIRESGYHEFPYAVFVWERLSGYAYGSSPAQDAMPDIKALNLIKKSSLQIAQSSAEPPMLATEGVNNIDTKPRGVTYLPNATSRLEALKIGENYPITLQELANYEQAIKDWFYVDYFLMLESKQGKMTATEVVELQGEKAATLSTFIVNLNDFLQTIITRTFRTLLRNGEFTEVPEALAGQAANLKIDFIGPLAQSQKKYHTMGGTVQALQIVGPIMQMYPNAGDYINGDELMKTAMEGQGLPQNVIREDDDVKKIREERAKEQAAQAAQQQQMAMAQSLMQNANKLGQTPQDGSLMQQMNEQLKGGMNGGV